MKNPRKFIKVSAAIISAILLCRCDMQTAGSSVGTGNPTEIQVAFSGDGGTPQGLTGSVEVYAATQVPVPGFQPEPLASFKVNGDKTQTVKASDLSAVADSLWPKSSREGDSIYRFNVVVKGDSEGVILRGLGYRRASTSFAVPDSLKNPGGKDGAVMVWADLAKTVNFSFYLDSNKIDSERDYFVFLPGTGYVTKNNGASFLFTSIPAGKYDDASFIFLWQKDRGPASKGDSVTVYGLSAELDTQKSDTISIGNAVDTLRLPIEYQ